jgi:CheY-like chemotaxis protein
VKSLSRTGKSVVVVDDDRDVAELVQTILIDDGFKVSCLYTPSQNDVKAAIDRIEPDCVLLDGGTPAAYGPSWDIAAWLALRSRPIPAVMLTGHLLDREEAIRNESKRAKSAHMAAVIPKPFDIDQLVTTVRHAVGEG